MGALKSWWRKLTGTGQPEAPLSGGALNELYDRQTAGRGMRISTLGDWLETSGKRTLSRDAFVEQYEKVTNYYFLAHA